MQSVNDNHVKERRFGQRSRTFKEVRLMLRGFGGHYKAIMRNLSRTGAMLDVPSIDFIPRKFKLRLVSDDVLRECEVVWRQEGLVGVVFTHPEPLER